ncbi:PA2779 family protein [Marivibrio halodurans]|uniref:PA2779 family protein n=1 Tax=Marivibrio halodurans TaxID=2039722 RepID=A0A8J7V2C4_9PROT|nr:PA2779 family protein [Marivibrio halodurans]MBP5858691.1 PA2779 family protein [Marivibrio halodurans]
MMQIKDSNGFRRVALALAMVMALASLPLGVANAGMVTTDRAIGQGQAAEARETIKGFMARDAVEEELTALGVDPAEAQARVGTLSDQEAVDLAQRIDEMPAGQGVGAIIGAGVFIFIVLLITDLLGFTHVFDFTDKGSANPT